MKKEISVLIDSDTESSFTNFDEEITSDDEIYWAIAHLAVLLQQRGYDPAELFEEVIEGMNGAEVIDNKPHGLLN
jgi:hypothetical protein